MLTLLCVKAMVVPALFVNYELRKDFIIKNYCVNKDRPELHCDGQCYLAKQLKAAEEKDQKEGQLTLVEKLYQWEYKENSNSFEIHNTCFVSTLDNAIHTPYLKNYKFTSTKGIFHPPSIV